MQTHAFVLSSDPLGEYDRKYLLLTPDLGVVNTFSKSVTKIASKLSGHLEPPHRIWVELVESNRGWQITSALAEESYAGILGSPEILRSVLQAGFVLKNLVPVSFPDKDLWDLWRDFLKEMASPENAGRVKSLMAQFLIKLTSHLGFMPSSDACAKCGHRFEREAAMLNNGRLLCGHCSVLDKQNIFVSPRTLKAIREVVNGAWISGIAERNLPKIANAVTENALRLMV